MSELPSSLYGQLRGMDMPARRSVAESLIAGIYAGSVDDERAYMGLCQEVLDKPLADHPAQYAEALRLPPPRGTMKAGATVDLLNGNTHRTRAFVREIMHHPVAAGETVIDAGTGASAVLAVAAAVANPRSEVLA